MASLKGNPEAKRKRNLITKKLIEKGDKIRPLRMEPVHKPRERKLTVHNIEDFMKEIDDEG